MNEKELEEKFVSMYRKGKSFSQIKEELDIGDSDIYYLMGKHGLPKRRPRGRIVTKVTGNRKKGMKALVVPKAVKEAGLPGLDYGKKVEWEITDDNDILLRLQKNSIREAVPSDLEGIREIADRPEVTSETRFIPQSHIKGWIEREQVRVAEIGKVVGFIHFNPNPTPPHIYYIAVEPEFQGRGIGSRLVNSISDRVRAKVTLSSEGFWKGLGFERIEEPQGKTVLMERDTGA